MSTNQTIQRPERSRTVELSVKEQPMPTAPTLDEVVNAICLDAQYDSLKFVLRSDTGHDGE
jgi:hypothetical protein